MRYPNNFFVLSGTAFKCGPAWLPSFGTKEQRLGLLARFQIGCTVSAYSWFRINNPISMMICLLKVEREGRWRLGRQEWILFGPCELSILDDLF